MAQIPGHKKNLSDSIPVMSAFAAMGTNSFGAFVAFQTEQVERVHDLNRKWLERMQAEAKFAAECMTKLTAARSIPEVGAVSQEWVQRRTEMMAEDVKSIVADGKRLAETSARFFSNGWQSEGAGNGST